MKIRMLDSLAGLADSFVRDREYEVTDEDGQKFVDRRLAVEVKPPAIAIGTAAGETFTATPKKAK